MEDCTAGLTYSINRKQYYTGQVNTSTPMVPIVAHILLVLSQCHTTGCLLLFLTGYCMGQSAHAISRHTLQLMYIMFHTYMNNFSGRATGLPCAHNQVALELSGCTTS